MPIGKPEDAGVEETAGVEVDEPTTDNAAGGADETSAEPVSSSDEIPVEENARDTVARVLKEAKEKENSPGDDSPKAEAKPVKPDQAKKAAKTDEKPEDFDPELSPPERFTARAKELFHNLPKGLKRELNKTVKDLEAMGTRSSQEAARAAAEYRDIGDAVKPFETKWAEAGLSRSSAIAALAAAHEKLTNPKTAVKTWLGIGADMGLPQEVLTEIQARLGGGTAQAPTAAPDISQHPEWVNSQKKLQQLESIVGNWQNQQVQSRAQSIVSEMAAVRDERDPASGQYLYPEMHEPGFFEQVKPLVSALIGTTPGLSYGDALKRAYYSMTGKIPSASNQQIQTRLPASDQTQRRAAAAAVSVRGRSAPLNGGIQMPDKIPDSPRDTARLALETLRRGV